MEIKKPETDGTITSWYWDVYIAKSKDKYLGMAREGSKGKEIYWQELLENNLDEEMEKICERFTFNI